MKTKIYLIIPAEPLTVDHATRLKNLLNGLNIQCVRINTANLGIDEIKANVKCIRTLIADTDVKILLENHIDLVIDLRLDGIHFSLGNNLIWDSRRKLGRTKIIGVACSDSKHRGLVAAEQGADYISFLASKYNNSLEKNEANLDLFKWWSDFIEIALVAENLTTTTTINSIRPYADFLGVDMYNASKTTINMIL